MVEFKDSFWNLAGMRQWGVFLVGGGNGVAPSLNTYTSSNLTTTFGQRTTLSWIATGRFNVVFGDNPGAYAGFGWAFRDTFAQGNVKALVATAAAAVVVGTSTTGTPTWSLEVDVWNAASSYALTDLATTNLLDLVFLFKNTRV